MTYKYNLFLGIPVDRICQTSLDTANPHAVSIFIQNESEYLHEITLDGVRYLGKKLGNCAEILSFELIEANIQSLLNKLLPNYTYDKNSLVLLPVEES